MEGAGESAHFTIACEATVSVYFPPGPKPRHWHRLGLRFNASVLLVSLGSSADPALHDRQAVAHCFLGCIAHVELRRHVKLCGPH